MSMKRHGKQNVDCICSWNSKMSSRNNGKRRNLNTCQPYRLGTKTKDVIFSLMSLITIPRSNKLAKRLNGAIHSLTALQNPTCSFSVVGNDHFRSGDKMLDRQFHRRIFEIWPTFDSVKCLPKRMRTDLVSRNKHCETGFFLYDTPNESKDQSRQYGRLFQTSEKPALTEKLMFRRHCTGHSRRRPSFQKGRGKRPRRSATQQIAPSTQPRPAHFVPDVLWRKLCFGFRQCRQELRSFP